MERDWRCTRCEKLLGVLRDGRLHLKFARGHEYLVGLPVTSVCRGCRALNEIVDAKAQAVETASVSAAP